MEEIGTPAGEDALPPTIRGKEGDVTMDSAEPLNDLNTSGEADPTRYGQVMEPSDLEPDALRQESYSRDQPSHDDVKRLEEDKEQMRRCNDAKDMIFDAIYNQVSDKIKRMLEYRLGLEKGTSQLQFSKLSDAELKRFMTWLTEKKPFADIKESELGIL